MVGEKKNLFYLEKTIYYSGFAVGMKLYSFSVSFVFYLHLSSCLELSSALPLLSSLQ